MTQQPEALRLADWLESNYYDERLPTRKAAAELRRLHALNEDLYQQGVEFIARITTLEAALRQAVEAMESMTQPVRTASETDRYKRVVSSITAVKQALEGKA